MALEAEDVRRFAEATERCERIQEKLGMSPPPINTAATGPIKILFQGSGHIWGAAAMGFTAGACLIGAIIVAVWAAQQFGHIDSRFNGVDNKFSDVKNTNDVQDAYINKLRSEQPQKKEK